MNTIIVNGLRYSQIYKNINMLVFDMSGTVINDSGLFYKTIFNTLRDNGLNIDRKDMRNWYGLSKYEIMNYYLYNKTSFERGNENFGIMKSQIYKDFNNNILEQYFNNNNNIRLMNKNIPNLFNQIREKNIKICLNTGFNKNIQEELIWKLNLNTLIDDYICSDDVQNERPEPDMIETLMKRNNINDPKQVIKIGDTKNDILEGLNANCLLSIGVLTGRSNFNNLIDAGANHIINDLNDLEIIPNNKPLEGLNNYFL